MNDPDKFCECNWVAHFIDEVIIQIWMLSKALPEFNARKVEYLLTIYV